MSYLVARIGTSEFPVQKNLLAAKFQNLWLDRVVKAGLCGILGYFKICHFRDFIAAVGFPFHESDKKANVLSMPGPSFIAKQFSHQMPTHTIYFWRHEKSPTIRISLNCRPNLITIHYPVLCSLCPNASGGLYSWRPIIVSDERSTLALLRGRLLWFRLEASEPIMGLSHDSVVDVGRQSDQLSKTCKFQIFPPIIS